MRLNLKPAFMCIGLALASSLGAQTGPIVPTERELQQMQEQEQFDARDKREQAVLQKNYFSLGQAAKDGVNPMKDFVAANLPQAKGDDTATQDLTGFEMLGFALSGVAISGLVGFLAFVVVRRFRRKR